MGDKINIEAMGLDASALRQVQDIKESTTAGGIGGGYLTSATIPAEKDSAYSKLEPKDRLLVDKHVDTVRIVTDMNSEEERDQKPSKEEVEKKVHMQREISSTPEVLEKLQAEAEKNQEKSVESSMQR